MRCGSVSVLKRGGRMYDALTFALCRILNTCRISSHVCFIVCLHIFVTSGDIVAESLWSSLCCCATQCSLQNSILRSWVLLQSGWIIDDSHYHQQHFSVRSVWSPLSYRPYIIWCIAVPCDCEFQFSTQLCFDQSNLAHRVCRALSPHYARLLWGSIM